MSNKTIYALMFIVSIAGVCVCIFLPWTVDWLKKTEMGGLLVTLLILMGFIVYVGFEESKRIDKTLKAEHEEIKIRVSKILEDNERRKSMIKNSETV